MDCPPVLILVLCKALHCQSVCIDNRSRIPAVMLAGTVIFCLSYVPHDVEKRIILGINAQISCDRYAVYAEYGDHLSFFK